MSEISLLPRKNSIYTENILEKVIRIAVIILIIVILFIVSLFVFRYFVKNGITVLETEVNTLKENNNKQISGNEYTDIQNKQLVLNKLLKSRVVWSNFFEVFEQKILDNVSFLSVNSDSAKKAIIMKVKASSYEEVAEQLEVLREVENFESVTVSDIVSEKDNMVSFELIFNFNKF